MIIESKLQTRPLYLYAEEGVNVVNHKVSSRDIIKGIGAGFYLVDKNFRILWMNEHQSEWLGSPRHICGEHCYNIFEQRSHICRGCPALRVFKTGNTQQANITGIAGDGQKHYYQLTASPIRDKHNKVIMVLELVQDITSMAMQKRHNLNVIHKLKGLYKNLSSANGRLRHEMQRLKTLTANLSRFKHNFQKNYVKKTSELTKIKDELRGICKVNRTLGTDMDFKKTSSLITRFTCELMHTDTCVLRLIDGNKTTLVASSSYCVSDSFIREASQIKIGEGISGRVAQTKKPLVIYDVDKDPRVKYKELMRKEGVRSVLAVPVLFQDEVLGVISTNSKKLRYFSKEEAEVLSIFAYQVAIALKEARHYEDVHVNYFNTIHALVLAIEARDPYTRGHTDRVTKYALAVARTLPVSHSELEFLRYASEVHDVGKISIPDFILNKPGRLSAAERVVIEIHPVKGAEMLGPLEFLKPAIPIVRHHHERYDGRGYPDGLEKENIPLLARILACADVFDALTSDRPYRKSRFTIEEALTEIKNNAGSQFDPHIATVFIKVIRSQNFQNSYHKLSNHQ